MNNDETTTKLRDDLFKTCLACRNMEIELFWKRSTFYWVFVAAAFVAYGSFKGEHSSTALLISCFGLVASFAWLLGNIGSKWWQENWEQKLKIAAGPIVGDLFTPSKSIKTFDWIVPTIRYSVTKIAILLSSFTTFLWLGIFVREAFAIDSKAGWIGTLWHYRDTTIGVVTLLFILLLCIFARGSDKKS
jgi:hypothetical protein